MPEILEILLDALIDSLKVFGFAFVLFFIFSFVLDKLVNVLTKHKRLQPLFGSLSGLIPQCGVSVVGADLYLKSHISMGCIISIFFACSDEALPMLLSEPSKMIYIIPLLLIKLIGGFIIGFIVDLFVKQKSDETVFMHNHVGCHHHLEKNTKLYDHFIHPLLHSLQIFAYVLVINIIFGLIIYWIGGEEVLSSFLIQNKYITPLFSTIIGIIPNCASSVVLSELFLEGGLPFGALVSGLCMNAGLGFVILLKNKKNLKNVLIIFIILIISALIVGYSTIGIMSIFGI